MDFHQLNTTLWPPWPVTGIALPFKDYVMTGFTRHNPCLKNENVVTELNGVANTHTACISWEKLPCLTHAIHVLQDTIKQNIMVRGYNHQDLSHEDIQNTKQLAVYKS
jgi:hypothetical protein